MKRGIFTGAIAGIVMGISVVPISIISAFIGTIEPVVSEQIWTTSMYLLVALAHISLGLIWGSIFGLIYSRYYDSTPGKGVLKGLYFGLIIWLIKDVASGSYSILILQQAQTAKFLIYYGFFMWIIYGLVLGYLYKKE